MPRHSGRPSSPVSITNRTSPECRASDARMACSMTSSVASVKRRRVTRGEAKRCRQKRLRLIYQLPDAPPPPNPPPPPLNPPPPPNPPPPNPPPEPQLFQSRGV